MKLGLSLMASRTVSEATCPPYASSPNAVLIKETCISLTDAVEVEKDAALTKDLTRNNLIPD